MRFIGVKPPRWRDKKLGQSPHSYEWLRPFASEFLPQPNFPPSPATSFRFLERQTNGFTSPSPWLGWMTSKCTSLKTDWSRSTTLREPYRPTSYRAHLVLRSKQTKTASSSLELITDPLLCCISLQDESHMTKPHHLYIRAAFIHRLPTELHPLVVYKASLNWWVNKPRRLETGSPLSSARWRKLTQETSCA